MSTSPLMQEFQSAAEHLGIKVGEKARGSMQECCFIVSLLFRRRLILINDSVWVGDCPIPSRANHDYLHEALMESLQRFNYVAGLTWDAWTQMDQLGVQEFTEGSGPTSQVRLKVKDKQSEREMTLLLPAKGSGEPTPRQNFEAVRLVMEVQFGKNPLDAASFDEVYERLREAGWRSRK
jgi:hypothetical protein